jgi:hypothetical protein
LHSHHPQRLTCDAVAEGMTDNLVAGVSPFNRQVLH